MLSAKGSVSCCGSEGDVQTVVCRELLIAVIDPCWCIIAQLSCGLRRGLGVAVAEKSGGGCADGFMAARPQPRMHAVVSLSRRHQRVRRWSSAGKLTSQAGC